MYESFGADFRLPWWMSKLWKWPSNVWKCLKTKDHILSRCANLPWKTVILYRIRETLKTPEKSRTEGHKLHRKILGVWRQFWVSFLVLPVGRVWWNTFPSPLPQTDSGHRSALSRWVRDFGPAKQLLVTNLLSSAVHRRAPCSRRSPLLSPPPADLWSVWHRMGQHSLLKWWPGMGQTGELLRTPGCRSGHGRSADPNR